MRLIHWSSKTVYYSIPGNQPLFSGGPLLRIEYSRQRSSLPWLIVYSDGYCTCASNTLFWLCGLWICSCNKGRLFLLEYSSSSFSNFGYYFGCFAGCYCIIVYHTVSLCTIISPTCILKSIILKIASKLVTRKRLLKAKKGRKEPNVNAWEPAITA